MATSVGGSYWKLDDSGKLIGDFDPNSELDFPFICNYWLDADRNPIPLDDAKCTVEGFGFLDCQKKIVAQNVFVVRVKKLDGVELTKKKLYKFELSFGIADGQHDQKTFWLLVKDN